jgi:hypothetical protein
VNKKPLILLSLCAVVLLVLGSLTNVIGYQTVQSSHQQIIKGEINQRELFFQTIVDFANNKEIQRIMLKSQLIRGQFPISNIPVLTKNQLKHMYFIGIILSKIISKSKIHSLLEKYQVNTQGMLKEITAVIEKDPTIKGEITQLSISECDCENENTADWNYPVICLQLYPLAILILILYSYTSFFKLSYVIMYLIGATLNCVWF